MVTIDSGDATADLETAENIEICCSRVVSSDTIKPDLSQLHSQNKMMMRHCCHVNTIYANEEYPLHVKYDRDKLHPILKLTKSLPQYREKSRLEGDKLVINGMHYGIDDIPNLPPDLAAYRAAEKSNDTHVVFSGELSPYSNFHPTSFIVNGQKFHSSKQWVQYQKALTFGDSYIANKILNSQTAIECKQLSYQINGVYNDKWQNEGYEVCFDGIQEKFAQNHTLFNMIKSTTPKILAKATTDHLWGTGIALRDKCALDVDKWTSTGWLSRMLLTIREENP